MKGLLVLIAVIVALVAFQFAFIRAAKRDAQTKEPAANTTASPVRETAKAATPPAPKSAAVAQPPAEAKPANPGESPAPEEGKKKKRNKKKDDPNAGFFPIPHDLFPLPADIGSDSEMRQTAVASMITRMDLSEAKLSSVVAEVNGEPITYRDLVRASVMRFGEAPVGMLLMERVILAEIKGRQDLAAKEGETFEITAAEIDAGEQTFLRDNVPGKTKEQYLLESHFTPEYFRYQVYLNAASEKMFMEDAEFKNKADANPMFMQIWSQNLYGQYKSVSRFTENGEALPADVFGTIGDASVTTLDLAPMVMPGLSLPRQEKAIDDLIDQALLRQELKARGITVTDAEVIAAVSAEREKFRGDFFGYEAYLPYLDSTLPLEVEKFRLWLGIEKIMGKPTEEEIGAHFAKNLPLIGSAVATTCQLSTIAVDPMTELPKGADAWERALERIKKPLAELESGANFNMLVMRDSEDGPEIKKWGNTDTTKERVAGSLGFFSPKKPRLEIDEAVAALSFALRVGEWAGPVRSRSGYHLIRLAEAKGPRPVGLEGESFTDLNGNGRYDWPETIQDTNKNGKWDEGEPFVDQNGNKQYDEGEPYTDTDGSGKYDPPEQFQDVDGNGKWDDGEPYVDSIPNGHYDIGEKERTREDLLEDRARAFLASLRAKASIVRKLT